MKTIMIIDEIRTSEGALSYRAFEDRSMDTASYGLELEYVKNGETYRKIFYNVADSKEFVLKMNSFFAEKTVLPENIEEIAETYICSFKI
ncbi:MAG: DUF6514 family protein [Oscillospiraceae bacterium]